MSEQDRCTDARSRCALVPPPLALETRMSATVELLICVKCRKGTEPPADERRPGQRLFDEIAACEIPEGVTVSAVECLS